MSCHEKKRVVFFQSLCDLLKQTSSSTRVSYLFNFYFNVYWYCYWYQQAFGRYFQGVWTITRVKCIYTEVLEVDYRILIPAMLEILSNEDNISFLWKIMISTRWRSAAFFSKCFMILGTYVFIDSGNIDGFKSMATEISGAYTIKRLSIEIYERQSILE